jgi:hypothetical protein
MDIGTVFQNLAKQQTQEPSEENPQEPQTVAPENMEATGINDILTPPQD